MKLAADSPATLPLTPEAKAAEKYNIVKNIVRGIVPLITYPLFSILLMAITLLIFRFNPLKVMPVIWDGAFGGGDIGHINAISETIVKATPLILTGLSIVVAWRAGLFSIGGEGQLLMGALTATAISHLLKWMSSSLVIPVMIVGATATGALWGGIAGWLRIHRNVQEVISTIMLNYVALYLVGVAVEGPLQEASKNGPYSSLLPNSLLFAHLLPISMTNGIQTRLHGGVLIAVLAVPIIALYLNFTRQGFALKLVGSNIRAANVAHYNVDAIRMRAMLLSGGLCGLAGVVQLMGVSSRLSLEFSPGWGYNAIPVALMGGLTPLGTLLSALFFGALNAGSSNAERMINTPSVIINVVQAVAVMLIVSLRAWKRRASEGNAE